MKIVFMGTPEPAAKVLRDLAETKHEILAVVTQPDRPKGRGQKLSIPAVKEIALKNNLRVEQPEKVKANNSFISLIKSLSPDVIVVVAYGKILPKEILNIPKYGCLNIHASLLPKYRGAAPIQWALLNGEKVTGITIMKLDELLDTGPVMLQEKIKIDDQDNTVTLTKKLFEEGSKLLIKALAQLENGTAKFAPQNNAAATQAPAIAKESGEIDWKKSAAEIHNRIRAMYPWPGAHTFYKEKLLKILKSEIALPEKKIAQKLPGTVVEIVKNAGFIVSSGAGNLLIQSVQPAAKKEMPAYNFVIGHDVKPGETLPN